MENGRGIPRVKRISEIKSPLDLEPNEKAVPDSDLVYGVKNAAGLHIRKEVIIYVVRTEGATPGLTAIGRTGHTYGLTGYEPFKLVPYNKKFYRAKIEKRAKNPLGYIPKPH